MEGNDGTDPIARRFNGRAGDKAEPVDSRPGLFVTAAGLRLAMGGADAFLGGTLPIASTEAAR